MLLTDHTKRKIYIILTVCYATLIFVASSGPLVLPLGKPIFKDKTLHVIEYSILGFLTLSCFKNRNLIPITIFAFVIATLYGVSDELHQYFVPGRMFSVYDIAANSVGSFFGVFINSQLYRRRLNKR